MMFEEKLSLEHKDISNHNKMPHHLTFIVHDAPLMRALR